MDTPEVYALAGYPGRTAKGRASKLWLEVSLLLHQQLSSMGAVREYLHEFGT